jgi:Flagellar P-ring protein
MIRRESPRRLRFCAGAAPVLVAGLCLFALLGCLPTKLIRAKSDDETDRDRYGIPTVRDKATIGNADAVHVGGVGYVEGLDGTGGEAPQDSYHELLERQLVNAGVRKPKEFLASPDRAMVIVTAAIPPGTREGEPFDVEVRLPRGSKATSLRGGTLARCKLFTYAQAGSLRSSYSGSTELVLGHPVATAEGPLLVGMGFGKDEDEARLKSARVWNGGRSRIAATLRIVLNPEAESASMAALITRRLNDTFHGAFGAGSSRQVAAAHEKTGIDLYVPPAYRYNLPHFLRVVLSVPLHAPGDAGEGSVGYRQRLASDLLDPTRTVSAALRLEALGPDSIPALRTGLKSADVKVRFCSAEALAYLGNSAGGEELATIVQTQPLLRAYALTALASLDQKVSHVQLQEILAKPGQADEVRYGAFRALRTLNDKDEAVNGELLNDAFWLHEVAPGTEPLIHVSSSKRPEIVLFGGPARLEAPFALRAGDYCVTATENDVDHCLVAWLPLNGGQPVRKECPLKVDALLRTLADLGASYPEAIEILQQADQSKSLPCRLRADALPQMISVEELAEAGKKKADGTAAGGGVLLTNEEIGATPGLFDNQRPPKANPFGDGAPVQPERKPDRVLGGD